MAEAVSGAERHTRTWSVGATTVVADCRWLRFRRTACRANAVTRGQVSLASATLRAWGAVLE